MERCLTLTTAVVLAIGISLVIALASVLYNRNKTVASKYILLFTLILVLKNIENDEQFSSKFECLF